MPKWITITPEGYYTASLNGAKYLNVSIGIEVYSIDQYEAIYHRPDIVKLALELGDSQQAIAQLSHGSAPVQIAQLQPPKVWYLSCGQYHWQYQMAESSTGGAESIFTGCGFLQDYVRDTVRELTENAQTPTIPKITGSGEFFELVLAKK